MQIPWFQQIAKGNHSPKRVKARKKLLHTPQTKSSLNQVTQPVISSPRPFPEKKEGAEKKDWDHAPRSALKGKNNDLDLSFRKRNSSLPSPYTWSTPTWTTVCVQWPICHTKQAGGCALTPSRRAASVASIRHQWTRCHCTSALDVFKTCRLTAAWYPAVAFHDSFTQKTISDGALPSTPCVHSMYGRLIIWLSIIMLLVCCQEVTFFRRTSVCRCWNDTPGTTTTKEVIIPREKKDGPHSIRQPRI
jgi:hypothetical protein